MISLQAENAILKAENEGLRTAVKTEKRRRKRGRPLMEEMRKDEDGGAMFFSPNKVQQARDRMAEKDKEKDEASKAKEAEKEAKRRAKEEAQLMIEQRRGEREKARIAREKAKVEKQKQIE